MIRSKVRREKAYSTVVVAMLFCSLASFMRSVSAAEFGGPPEKSDITLTLPVPGGAHTPVYLAFEAGLFKKYGLNATLQMINPRVAVQAVISGEADVYTGGPTLANARLKGARVKYFGATIQQFVFQMWGAKEITDPKQLRQKSIGVTTPRSATDIVTREVLKKNGLIPDKDVKILYVDSTNAVLASMTTGTTSAGTLPVPATLQAREAGLNLLVDISKLNIPSLLVAYGSTEKFLAENPNTVYAFLKAIAEAVVLAKNDREMAKKAITKYAKLTDSKMLEETYNVFEPYWKTNLAVRPEAIQSWLVALDEKEFPEAKGVHAEEFIDNSFVSRLEKSGVLKTIEGKLQR